MNLDWKKYIEIDRKLIRTVQNVTLLSDPKKIYNELGWKSEIDLEEVLIEMIKFDLNKKKNSSV